MSKRLVTLCLVLALVVLGVAPVSAKVHLIHYNYPGHGQPWTEFLADRAKVFNAQNPDIEVEILTAGSTAEYTQKFQVMLAGGTPPDVTEFHPALGATQIITGVFADLRPFLAKDNVNLLRATSPYVMNVITTNTGSIWGLPADIYPVVTFYNEDMLNNAGVPSPSVLGDKWTWEQAMVTGRKTTIDSNADGVPEQWGLDRMWARWYMWIHQAGGSLYDKIIAPTKSNWNTPAVIQGLNFPLTAMQEGVGPKTTTKGYAQTYFWFGKSAVNLMDGPGTISLLKNVTFSWNIARQVRGPVNAGTEITVDAFEMVDAGTHKDEAWKWMKFLSLDVESHSKMVTITGRAPSLSVLQRQYQQLCKDVPSNFMAFFESASAAGTQTNYLIAQQAAINAIVNPMITKIFTGGMPIETAVQQIHEQVSVALQAK